MRQLHIFLFMIFAALPVVSQQAKAADASVDGVLAQWDTFSDNSHLDTDYKLAEVLDYPDKKAYVLTYDNPQGENKRYYRYLFVDQGGSFLYEISVGSYDATTQIDREMGHIGPNDRLYHLDMYCPGPKDDKGVSKWGGHHTLGFFESVPDFEGLTKSVREKEKGQVRCQQGKSEGLSSTFKNPNKK